MGLAVSMETAEHPTTVHVRLDGRGLAVTFVYHCLGVNMELARMLLNATAMRAGKVLTVTFLAVTTALMESALLPMNVSASMDGLVITAMLANQ